MTAVVGVAAGYFQLQSLDEFIFGITVDLQVVRVILLVSVLQVQDGVETVVVGGIQVIVHQVVEQVVQRAVRIVDGTVTPYTVEEVVHTGVGCFGRRASALDGARIVGVEVDGQLAPFDQSVHTCLQTFVVGVEQDTFLVVVGYGCVVADRFGTSVHADVVALLPGSAEYFVLIVVLRNVPVVFQRILLAVVVHEVSAFDAGRINFGLQFHEVVSIHHVQGLCHLGDTEAAVVGNLCLADFSLFGGNDDNAVRTTCTIDGCGRGILQDVNGLDIRGVDGASCFSIFYGEAVDDVKRRVVLRQRVVTTDGDVHGSTGLAFT